MCHGAKTVSGGLAPDLRASPVPLSEPSASRRSWRAPTSRCASELRQLAAGEVAILVDPEPETLDIVAR
jgi:hypothetical protein